MLYRWPQGRIIRVIAMILVALIAFDFGWAAWARYGSIAGAGLIAQVSLGVLATLAVVVFVGGMVLIGFHPKSAQFLIEVEGEMGKVTWPTRSELIRLTIVIAVIALVLTGVIALVDLFNMFLKEQFFLLPKRLGLT